VDERARHELEGRLADLLRAPRWQIREYFSEISARVRHSPQRIIGVRFQRGTHSGCYVRDPQGTDIVPSASEPPPFD